MLVEVPLFPCSSAALAGVAVGVELDSDLAVAESTITF
ncbi:hypothetical protein J2Z77_000455 [Streptomyces avidinii]|uniref:Uncharacterized protein n=1 Tax=Streptomyces avidinii TaxID=1895 RepID=A0ABS4KZ63_STRAV|nr:hypothetical protein [Streptomyces avidinii]